MSEEASSEVVEAIATDKVGEEDKPALSKNQQKRLRKQAKWQEKKIEIKFVIFFGAIVSLIERSEKKCARLSEPAKKRVWMRVWKNEVGTHFILKVEAHNRSFTATEV